MSTGLTRESLNEIIANYNVHLKGSYLSFNHETHRTKIKISRSEEFEICKKYEITLSESFDTDLFSDLKSTLLQKSLLIQQEKDSKKAETIGNTLSTIGGCLFNFDINSTLILRPVNSEHDDIFLDGTTNSTIVVRNQKKVLDVLRDYFNGPKEFAAWRREHIKLVNIKFNPSTVDKFVTGENGSNSGYFNLYKAPKWRYLEDTEEEPEEFLQLLTHLFEDEESRDVVMRWLHDAIFLRASTHLLLHGQKGTGKTSLARLALALVGEENSHTASSSQIDSSFDSSLENTVLYFWDELDFSTQRAKNKLKKYINTDFALEQKFKDSHEVSKIYASHIICNNSPEDCFLEADDRVFTVPNVTERHLKKLWNTAKIKKFLEKSIKKDEFLAKIGFFLKNKYSSNESVSSVNTYISDNYVTLVNSSVRPFYKRAFIQLCYEMERFDIADVRNRCRDITGSKTSVSVAQMRKFLRNYETYLGIELAKPYGKSGSFESLVYEGEGSIRKDVMPFPVKEK